MKVKCSKYIHIGITFLSMLLFPLCCLYLEIIFSTALHHSLDAYGYGFSLSIGVFLLSLSFAFRKPKASYVLQGIFISLLSLIYIAQFLYYRIFRTYFIVQSLKGTGNAMFFSDVLLNVMARNLGWILLLVAPVAVIFITQRFLLHRLTFTRKLPVACLVTSLLLYGLTAGLVLRDKVGVICPRSLYISQFVPDKSAQSFGILTMMGLDIRYNVLHLAIEENLTVKLDDITYIKAADVTETTTLTTSETTKDISDVSLTPAATPTPTPQPNVMDISFNLSEEDDTYREMNEYFSSVTPTMTNEYTGIFEGKNLILITAEGFSGYVIDPELTPTLYELSTEGFVFDNFYTPVWGVSTSDGEFVATTGLIPEAGVWSYTEIADNYMPFAFGNQFSALGYLTNAYHDHTYDYYNRDLSYPNMGYTYEAVGLGMDIAVTWPESDLEMMQVTVPEYVGNAPFHVYYMTVSGHLRYTFSGNYIANKNRDLVSGMTCSANVQAYYACQIELDRALQSLIEQLDAAGQLDNTVIALSADHYPYGLEEADYNELAGKDVEETFELYENTFILWCSDMEEPVYVDTYCSSLDIAPTLSNLFGLEYDSRLYIGTDIFADTAPTVIFQDRSFINDKIMYDANTNEVTLLTDEVVTDEYVEGCIQAVNDKFKYSSLIISEDYYRDLFGAASS